MLPLKPYLQVPIEECWEPLVDIPAGSLAFYAPHPYVEQGAEALYSGKNPWRLRKSVLDALLRAQQALDARKKGWKIKIFDAWRPNEVQSFMVEKTFRKEALRVGLDPERLSAGERDSLAPAVFALWGFPSDDPRAPPPHSTGAAIDCTLVDENGNEVDMGSPIDSPVPQSMPSFFSEGAAYENRKILCAALCGQDFRQHPREWWHFSLGDQLWAYTKNEEGAKPPITARYGRAPEY